MPTPAVLRSSSPAARSTSLPRRRRLLPLPPSHPFGLSPRPPRRHRPSLSLPHRPLGLTPPPLPLPTSSNPLPLRSPSPPPLSLPATPLASLPRRCRYLPLPASRPFGLPRHRFIFPDPPLCAPFSAQSAPSSSRHPPLTRLFFTAHGEAPLLPRPPAPSIAPIPPPMFSRFLSAGPTPTRTEPEEDKGKKTAAAAVVMEASAMSPRKDAEASMREGSEDDDEDAGLPWRGWRPDVTWLSKALEPALQINKHYKWKPLNSSSPLLPT